IVVVAIERSCGGANTGRAARVAGRARVAVVADDSSLGSVNATARHVAAIERTCVVVVAHGRGSGAAGSEAVAMVAGRASVAIVTGRRSWRVDGGAGFAARSGRLANVRDARRVRRTRLLRRAAIYRTGASQRLRRLRDRFARIRIAAAARAH